MGSNPTGVREFFSFSIWAHSFLELPPRRYYLGYLLEHFNLPHLKHYKCLTALSSQTLLVTPSLTCSLATNYLLNSLRPAPIWPCSSVSRATVICCGGRGFEPHRGQRVFLFLHLGPFLSRATAQKVLFGIFIRALQLTTFKPLYIVRNMCTFYPICQCQERE